MKYKLPSELIIAYDDLFIGNGIKFPLSLFTRYSPSICSRLSLELFRYAFETKLQWNPYEVRDYLTMNILKMLKLSSLLQFITFPDSLEPEDNLFYIAWLIYPQTKNKSLVDVEIEVYKNFLENKIPKMPKGFFSDENGIVRAYNCLIFAINYYHPFSFENTYDRYEFFASSSCVPFMRKAKLVKIYNSLDITPLEFFHYALGNDQRNDVIFNYLLFKCQIPNNK